MLLQKDIITAPDLAEQFEVSRRTINRDIEDFCRAGIPIVTRQGVNGGISIMENYRMDRTLLTNSEMQDILVGLRSLDNVNGTNRFSTILQRESRYGWWRNLGRPALRNSQMGKIICRRNRNDAI